MICLDSEARHLKQRPFSGLVNKNTGGGYSPIIFVHCVNVTISKTSITFQVGVFHSMSKVWQQHICRQMKFNCCYHSEILLAATTGHHSAAAGVTADTRSASFSTGIPKWHDLFMSRLYGHRILPLPYTVCLIIWEYARHISSMDQCCIQMASSWMKGSSPSGSPEYWGIQRIHYESQFSVVEISLWLLHPRRALLVSVSLIAYETIIQKTVCSC